MKTIDAEELRAQCLKVRYSRRLVEPDVFPSDSEWEYITSRAMTGIGASLYRKYLVSWCLPEDHRTEIHCSALHWFPLYVEAVPRDYALSVVYGDISSCPKATLAVIHKARLFDTDMLRDILRTPSPASPPLPNGYYPLAFVVECLDAYQPEYDYGTLESMRELYADITDPKPLGRITDSKAIFGGGTKYECPQGHINDACEEYCTHPGCGLNIYGLRQHHEAMIEEYAERIDALATLLTNKPAGLA